MEQVICPLCHTPLQDSGSDSDSASATSGPATYSCASGHSFDQAKQGYLNLLPVQHKRSKSPGDDKQMVLARQQFLNNGHYTPLAERITALFSEQLQRYLTTCEPSEHAQHAWLDAGCGEGYYTEHIIHNLNKFPDMPHGHTLHTYGLDIAKPAVVAACQRRSPKTHHNLSWLVGSLKNIPLEPQSLCGMLSVFSPILPEHFASRLRPNGWLLTVTPGAHHLQQLKQQLYGNASLPKNTPITNTITGNAITKSAHTLPAPWQRVHQEQLRFQLALNNSSDIQALLAMTPHSWRAKPERKAVVAALNTLSCETDFTLSVWTLNHE